MGLDSRDHTKSGPTGSGSFLHDVIRQRDGKRKLDPSGKSPDLAPLEHQKFTNKLDHFWTLDFAAFRAEVKRALETEIAVKDRADREEYLAEKSAEVTRLSAEVEAAEREIDAIVCKLFDLTTDEIKLLEDSLEGQY